jgi:serine/alanine adding enzyme
MEIEILNNSSLSRWKQLLEKLSNSFSDVFYLPNYYKTFELHENAEFFCFVFVLNGFIILYPFFKKPISEFDLGGNYFDIFNAYGYGGAISNSPNVPENVINSFNKEFDKWCADNNIVTELIRDNPLHPLRIREANYSKIRTNVYAEPFDDNNLSRIARKEVRLSLKKGLDYEIDPEMKNLDRFIELYNQSAMRLKMRKYYLFDKSYFQNVKENLSDCARLINIYCKDKIISSLLLFYCGKKGDLHLTGSDFDFMDHRPNDLLYKVALDDARSNNIEILCLGGGTSTNPEDGLFRFKKKFGKIFKDVFIGKKIFYPDKYSILTKLWEEKYPHLKEAHKCFLQKYRLTE